MRLPVRYFDSTKTGVLISRIMTDAEGIRNLVGTGLVQLTGGVVTAVLALGVLFYLNWHLTLVTIVVLGAFGGVHGATRSSGCGRCSASAARSTPRSPAGCRVARRHPHRQGLHRREARGAGLRQGRAPAVPQRRAVDDRRLARRPRSSTVIVGVIGVVDDR